ncbi:MAG TPA: AAA family ATPase [Methylophilus sp.]|uniref:AAA family ATPase n=1 Tax=Methylophilus sp. TaxID=29541 RepID=UPI002BE02789|nr:AAA family ATPase [Methylophilus sp.]HSH85772.1 AAA family ATPase [Methylophilus sp.]
MTEFNLSYMHKTNGAVALTIETGSLLFLLGSNGTGKSTLMHHFGLQNAGKVKRITAHRQIWFNSDSPELTAAGRARMETSFAQMDRQEYSRYKDEQGNEKSHATLYDLIDAENIDARKIAEAFRAGHYREARQIVTKLSPLARMNQILRMSNMNFEIHIGEVQSKLIVVKNGIKPYSIPELSDGERNALIIIATVLTCPENTLILLDEPERHLHRSIVSPLISTLLSFRQDCAFVVSTHDVSLPCDQTKANALLVREYSHSPKSWLIDYVNNVEEIDEGLATTILGSRRKLLFIEGLNSSLDNQIFQILFPNISIKALGSCNAVERVVAGIKAAHNETWLTAYGIIDKDNRTAEQCVELEKVGIFTLKQYSIESLYYHPKVYEEVLKRMSSIHKFNMSTIINDIEATIIRVVNQHKSRLAARLVERKVKETAQMACPDWRAIQKKSVEVNFSTGAIYHEELGLIESYLQTNNIEMLISRYPLRETQALEEIAKRSFCATREIYEDAVRKMLIESPASLDAIRTLLNPATQYLN